jgi:general secretion pathway protein C
VAAQLASRGVNARIDLPPMDLPRPELDRALGNLSALAQTVAVEREPGGGWRLMAVAPGTLLVRLGLKAGDVVRRVDGRSIETAEQAYEVYTALGRAERLTIEVERRGTPVLFRYVVTPTQTASR